MIKVRKVGLFADRDNLEDAFKYVEKLVETLQPTDKFAAYTAVYVLYNTVLNIVSKEGLEVVSEDAIHPFGTENTKQEKGV